MNSIWIIIWFAAKASDTRPVSDYEMFLSSMQVVNFIEENRPTGKEMHVFKVQKKVRYIVLPSGKVILDEKKK